MGVSWNHPITYLCKKYVIMWFHDPQTPQMRCLRLGPGSPGPRQDPTGLAWIPALLGQNSLSNDHSSSAWGATGCEFDPDGVLQTISICTYRNLWGAKFKYVGWSMLTHSAKPTFWVLGDPRNGHFGHPGELSDPQNDHFGAF